MSGLYLSFLASNTILCPGGGCFVGGVTASKAIERASLAYININVVGRNDVLEMIDIRVSRSDTRQWMGFVNI